MGKLPEQTFISLHEALTDLAFDDPITAEHQRSLGLPPDADLNNLIDQCFVEARSDERYRNFLETFSTRPGAPIGCPNSEFVAPIGNVVAALEACYDAWPPSGEALMKTARSEQQREEEVLQKYNSAFRVILEDAKRCEGIVLWGRPEKPTASHVRICRGALLGRIEAPFSSDRLDEYQNAFEGRKPIVVRKHLFFDVCMERSEFEILKKSLGGKPRRSGRPPKYDWPTIRSKIHSILDDEGLPDPKLGDPKWKSKADLIHKVQDWCSEQWDRHPANSTLKPVVNEIIAEFEAKRAAGN